MAEKAVKPPCSQYDCARPSTRELGHSRAIPYCDGHSLHGHAWARAGMCSLCQGPLGVEHHHDVHESGHAEAACCSCVGCDQVQQVRTADEKIDWALYEQMARDEAENVEPIAETDGGRIVMASTTGKTAHTVRTHEPLEAACGTRTIRNAKEPQFYASLPPGVGHCWKCVRDG